MNILILDDVRLVRETVKESLFSLKGWNLTVREASNGFDALDILKRNPIDVVLVDIKMPKMNGLEFIKKASLHYNDLHFIILSSFSEFDYARSALKMGVSDYLLKPVSDEELRSVLSRIQREMESEEKQDLLRMERELNNFLNHPVKKKKPENAFFFCFHPKVGTKPDASFYLKINRLTDDLSKRLNEMGISCIIRNGDNLWQCLLYTDREQYKRIHREVRDLGGLLDNGHIFIHNPEILAVTPCFSEHRSLFFRNLSALALLSESPDYIDNPYGFSSFIDRLRGVSDSLSAMTRGIYAPWRVFYHNLVDTLNGLADISAPSESVVINHLLDLFSIGLSEKNSLTRQRAIERIEAEYMRLQFKSDIPFPGNVITYVRNNYMHPINISEIAGHLGKTPNALSSAFSKATGQTLNRFITSVRMENAEKLLISTELSSKQIGEMVGIADAGYFCKVFKDLKGLSPMDYRKENASGH